MRNGKIVRWVYFVPFGKWLKVPRDEHWSQTATDVSYKGRAHVAASVRYHWPKGTTHILTPNSSASSHNPPRTNVIRPNSKGRTT